MAKLLIALLICSSLHSVSAKTFFEKMGDNLKKSFTPSEFICDKYEQQEYEAMVLRPGLKLPFTELHPKTKVCIDWGGDDTSALGKKCIKHKYINTSKEAESRSYHKVKRHRTVCVEGYSTR